MSRRVQCLQHLPEPRAWVWLPEKPWDRGEDQQDSMVASEERCTVPIVYKWSVNHRILMKVIGCSKLSKLTVYSVTEDEYFSTLSLADKTIKLWKISERDKRPEGYNLKEEDGRYRDFNTVTTLRVRMSCYIAVPVMWNTKKNWNVLPPEARVLLITLTVKTAAQVIVIRLCSTSKWLLWKRFIQVCFLCTFSPLVTCILHFRKHWSIFIE